MLGDVLLGDGLRVIGGVLLGEGLPMLGGAFGADGVGPAEVVPCGVDRVIAPGADCVDGGPPDPLWRLRSDAADTVVSTGATRAADLVLRLSPRVLPAGPEGGAMLLAG
jgi:hypothetical protein